MKRSELLCTFLLIPVDLAMIFLSFLTAYWLRTYFEFVPVVYVEPMTTYLKFIIETLPIWLVVFIFNGLYMLRGRYRRLEEFGKIFVAVSAATAIIMAWLFLSRTLFFSRLIIVYVWFITIFLVTFGRFLIHNIQALLYRWGIGVHRVIILGGNTASRYIISGIQNNPGLGYKLIKVIDDNAIDRLETIFARHKADEIIVANTHLSQVKIAQILEFCRAHQIGFKMTPDLFLVRSSHVDVDTLFGVPIMEFKRTPLDGWGRIIKRISDLLVSFLLIIILSPIMVLVAFLVKLTSKGSILFRQTRVGLEKNFTFYKFRTMREGAEKEHEKYIKKYGNMFKLANDPRLTPVGKFLRKTSLDELPQFFNVLRGDMSLIGPRPPMPEEVAKYTNWQKRRLGVKPGITGLWQVSGRSAISFDEWVKLDAYYIENWSLWLDFQIFLKTIWVVIKGRGAY